MPPQMVRYILVVYGLFFAKNELQMKIHSCSSALFRILFSIEMQLTNRLVFVSFASLLTHNRIYGGCQGIMLCFNGIRVCVVWGGTGSMFCYMLLVGAVLYIFG